MIKVWHMALTFWRNTFCYSGAYWSQLDDIYTLALGNWNGSIPIPDQSFEVRERWLSDEDHELFVRFIRSMLRWVPEERPTAEELAYDEFLMQPQLARLGLAKATSENGTGGPGAQGL